MQWLAATLVVFVVIPAATASEPEMSPPRLDVDTRGFTAPVLGVAFSPDKPSCLPRPIHAKSVWRTPPGSMARLPRPFSR